MIQLNQLNFISYNKEGVKMHLRKAIERLNYLINNEPDDLSKYAIAHSLLSGFEAENRNNDGSVIDGYAEEKISSVRIWFNMLCGIGEDG